MGKNMHLVIRRGSDGKLYSMLRDYSSEAEIARDHLDPGETLVRTVRLEGPLKALAVLACDALDEGEFGDEFLNLIGSLLNGAEAKWVSN